MITYCNDKTSFCILNLFSLLIFSKYFLFWKLHNLKKNVFFSGNVGQKQFFTLTLYTVKLSYWYEMNLINPAL